MHAPRCPVCGGGSEPLHAGAAGPFAADALSPSNHRPGEHGALFRCLDCGTVQQPGLPGGEVLHELYRDMDDDAYLEEEAGRRRTARRLLDRIGAHVPRGRLLDVGCGPGLLLDEARARGYEVTGLELSRSAAAHARGLGLSVRETPLEDFAPAEPFAAIVLADVLEHLSDPVAALDRCAELLEPGGVICVVTPDPSSATARIAGRRWWGYLPGHACLLPHRTLAELLAARGLVISADEPLVRSFSLGRWIAGLAERAGPLSAPLGRLARSRLAKRPVSLPLGDERVVLAHRVEPLRPPRPLLHDRGRGSSVHVVLPAYAAAQTIPAVAAAMPRGAADRALLCDDASPDGSWRVALAQGFEVIRHPANRGYGANQKTCYARALADGADVVVMVHADNQYDPALVREMAAPILAGKADAVMGSRLLDDRAVAGGMPRWKWLGNRLLTAVQNRVFDRTFSEYHTGYRAFSADLLRSIAFLRNSDDFVFDQEIFAQIVARRARVAEVAIPTRYFNEASSVGFGTSLRYGLSTLVVLARYRRHERGRAWPLLRAPAARLAGPGAGQRQGMASHDEKTQQHKRPATAPPPEARNQATAPPANPPTDDEALEKARDRLEQAGGGH